MSIRQDQDVRVRDAELATDEPACGAAHSTAAGTGSHRPSDTFRRALNRRGADPSIVWPIREESKSHPDPGRAPALSAVLAAAIAVGAVSGFLELAVLFFQVRGLHLVDWSTLMISRHAAWMIPTAGTAVIACLALAIVGPALALASWRRRITGADAPGWVWDWAGTVLGTLLILGPLLAIRGFHVVAPVAVSVGVGFRIRRAVVRPTRRWQRLVHRAGAIAVVVLAVNVLSPWRALASIPGAGPPRPAGACPNLLWIVLDTLRADRMGLYGYPRPTTPELDRWARDGITFDMARSVAPWTLPSHISMFTGMLPSEHDAGIDHPYIRPDPTLAEHLGSQGYATAGIVANVRMCNAAYGVGRGFDRYVDYPWKDEISLKAALSQSSLGSAVLEVARRMLLPVPSVYPFSYHQSAREIAGAGRRWLEDVPGQGRAAGAGPTRPYFLFLNFMDVHGPYLPMADAPRRFWEGPAPTKKDARPEDGWLAVQARDVADAEHRPQRQGELDAVARRLGDLYDDCILGLDAELGRFLGGLSDRGLLANTWVVITADHGEHFGEHGQFGHGSSLYNEMTHVPLILIPPLGNGRAATDPYAGLRGRRIGVPVSLRDLPRTMTELLLAGSNNPFPGRSLARHWRASGPEAPDPVLSELEEPRLKGEDFRTEQVSRIESIIEEDHVLIEYPGRTPELFSLFGDPKQQDNLAGRADQGPRRRRMEAALDAVLRRTRADSTPY